ncbi:MAG: TIGR01244 family phosphatase [Alphaproteobacteria bacterium]|nr:TIGR01244 family phosphatase [Alphaproteobacteria bacterium]
MPRTTEIAPGLFVAAQLNAADVPQLAEEGFRTIINNRPDGEESAQPPASVVRDEAKHHDIAYIYQPVSTSAIAAKDVAELERNIASAAKPIVAHCRSGTRTYLMWATGQALKGKDPAALVAEAATKGYDLRSLPALVERVKAG